MGNSLILWCRSIIATLVLVAAAFNALAASVELSQEREKFLQAEQALDKNNQALFKKLSDSLVNYPLYPYLRYQFLVSKISSLTPKEIEDFQTRYPDTLLAEALEKRWLIRQGELRNWDTYLTHYQPSADPALQCYYLRALYQSGAQNEAMNLVAPLWLVASSQPDSCTPLFDTWIAKGHLTSGLAWQRFHLAMGASKYRLAQHLVKHLDAEHQQWAKHWLNVKTNPSLVAHSKALSEDTEITRMIVADGLKRWARFDAIAATDAWQGTIKDRFSFSDSDRHAIEKRLALSRLLQQDDLEDTELSHLLDNPVNQELQEWRIRVAISLGDWEAALNWLDRMNPDSQNAPRWRYWRARALSASAGDNEQAAGLYQGLAADRSYYGFLSASRIGAEYRLNDARLEYPDQVMAQISTLPGIQRARELFYLGRFPEARREWQATTRTLTSDQLAQAARLAGEWGWHDRAIFTLANTPYTDDLSLRFPIVHQQQILKETQKNNLNPSWVLALIRQESAFMPDARSQVGALGLMQIMPKTGKEIGKRLAVPLKNPRALLDADLNIKFGISYLKSNLKNFNNNHILATAAYNAGSGRVNKWLPKTAPMEPDQWIEAITFQETRDYVQNIMAYSVIYDYRLGLPKKSFRELMQPVYPRNYDPNVMHASNNNS
ncbi:MAG: transglycosylase SLT domain-containing protein [Pseudomonadota bacterium]